MRDILGWRRKFGVIGPSTNTIVQPDFEMMRPPGVTNHYRGIFTPNNKAVSNDTFMAGAHVIGGNVLDAVKNVMTSEPDYLVMGMSAVTFFGGAAGADAFRAKIESAAGAGISIGSHSSTAALKAYGGVKRIAFLSPYYPVANAEVRRYFTDRASRSFVIFVSNAKAGRRSRKSRRTRCAIGSLNCTATAKTSTLSSRSEPISAWSA